MKPSVMALLLLIAVASTGQAETPRGILGGVGFDQKLGEQIPLNLSFRDEAGHPVALGDDFNNKPVILVLAYYRCPMLCTRVLNGLLEGLRGIPMTVGDEFNVVTVSFDPHDSPQIAAAKKANYLEQYGRPAAASGWHFLTGEPTSIGPLTRAAGFRYRYDPSMDQYAHPSGILILTPQGKIARYLPGVEFSPKEIRAALVEASDNRIGTASDRAFLFCYEYDEATGKYTPQIMRLLRILGVVTVLGLGGMILILRRRSFSRGPEGGANVALPSGPRLNGGGTKATEI